MNSRFIGEGIHASRFENINAARFLPTLRISKKKEKVGMFEYALLVMQYYVAARQVASIRIAVAQREAYPARGRWSSLQPDKGEGDRYSAMGANTSNSNRLSQCVE